MSHLPLNPSTHLLLPHFSSKPLVHPLPCHGFLQCSVHHCRRKKDPAIERGITRQSHVGCVDRINKPTEGPRCYKGGHWRSQRTIGKDGRPAMVCGQSVPRDEGRSLLARQCSPCTRCRGPRPTCALSSCLTIGKEHRSVMPTRPTTRILTSRKVTIRHQLVVPMSSSYDDIPSVKHDTRVDLNPGGVRICYTQEAALMSDSPPSSLPPYILLG
jgi:hypothetical protein